MLANISRIKIIFIGCIILLLPIDMVHAQQSTPFRFESVLMLEDMKTFVQNSFNIGTSRENLRNAFVSQGNATLIQHPSQTDTEKYIYDINICRYYIWRWNISIDYDNKGKLQQAYVNGEAIFPKSDQEPEEQDNISDKNEGSIFVMQRLRPEADKGEKSLGYILFDRDSNPDTIDDQSIIGAGPTRVDPRNMGQLYAYNDVDLWRSIFDPDPAKFIAPYGGQCP